MYQLYYYPLNASLAPHFVLRALEVEYELVLVDRKSQGQKSKEYLALNPAGRIPTLVDDGKPVFESPAICMYLAEKHSEANLVPSATSPYRADFLQWMMYLTNTLQAELMIYFYPEKHTVEPSAKENILSAQNLRLKDILALLDNELANRDFLAGPAITVCDYFMFMLAIWADEILHPPLSFKHLAKYLRGLAQREEIKAVCAIEGISLQDYQ